MAGIVRALALIPFVLTVDQALASEEIKRDEIGPWQIEASFKDNKFDRCAISRKIDDVDILEWLQKFTPDRSPDFTAAFAGGSGALLGAILFEIVLRLRNAVRAHLANRRPRSPGIEAGTAPG